MTISNLSRHAVGSGLRPRRTTLESAGYLAVGTVVLYVVATLAGSVFDPSYSQIRQHISDLTAIDAPTWAALAPLYVLYNVLAAAFAIQLYRSSSGGRLWQVGTGLLVVNAFSGVMMVTFFREDAGGIYATTMSTTGAGHIVFASLSSLVIVVASFVYAIAFRRSSAWRPLAAFSFIVGVGFAVLGPLAGYAAAQKSDLAGLAERGPIGLFILWQLVVGMFAIVLARRHAKEAPPVPREVPAVGGSTW